MCLKKASFTPLVVQVEAEVELEENHTLEKYVGSLPCPRAHPYMVQARISFRGMCMRLRNIRYRHRILASVNAMAWRGAARPQSRVWQY